MWDVDLLSVQRSPWDGSPHSKADRETRFDHPTRRSALADRFLLASQRRRRGVQSSSGLLPLAPAWAINGRSRIWLQNAGDVLIWRPVSVQVPLILVTSKFGWERGRKSGDQGTLPLIGILRYVTFPTKKQRSMRLVQISAVGPQL